MVGMRCPLCALARCPGSRIFQALSRKTFLHATAVLAIALSATPSLAGVPIESQDLQDLYQAALAEGGSLFV